MPTITEREQVPEGGRHHFDSIVESRGSVRGPYSVLMHTPEVAGRAGHLGAYLRYESELPGAERELAIITAVREFDCAYPWAAHVRIAREEGVREAAIEAVRTDAPVDDLTDAEALIVQYGRELFREYAVSDATFRAARERFGVQGVTELTATMGYYSMMACVLNAFGVTPDGDGPELP